MFRCFRLNPPFAFPLSENQRFIALNYTIIEKWEHVLPLGTFLLIPLIFYLDEIVCFVCRIGCSVCRSYKC